MAIETREFPTEIDDAERLLAAITSEAQAIQDQLSDRDRTHPDGTRLTGEEYWSWRKRAVDALRHIRDEQRDLKFHVKKLKVKRTEPRTGHSIELTNALVRAYREGDVEATGRYLAALADAWEVR